ncbi:MAG: CoA transferase, partial [Chloroflexota bacterium]
DLICFHMGGLGYTTPRPADNARKEQPLKPPGRQADFISGVVAATATLCAVLERRMTGRGQHVDVSQQESVALLIQWSVTRYTYAGMDADRSADTQAGLTAMIACKNGYFSLETMTEGQWRGWAHVMGDPDWTRDEMCRDRKIRAKNWKKIVALMGQWAANRTKQEIWELAQDNRVPVMPVNTVEDIVNSDQLASRGFFAEVEHPEMGRLRIPGAPCQFSRTPWKAARPAPLLGQHNEEVLCEELGWQRRDLVSLRQAGVI